MADLNKRIFLGITCFLVAYCCGIKSILVLSKSFHKEKLSPKISEMPEKLFKKQYVEHSLSFKSCSTLALTCSYHYEGNRLRKF